MSPCSCVSCTLPCHPEHAWPNESTVSPACLTIVDINPLSESVQGGLWPLFPQQSKETKNRFHGLCSGIAAYYCTPRHWWPVSSTLGHAMAVPFWGRTVTPKRPKLVSPPEPLAAFGSIWKCAKTWARKPIPLAPILFRKYHTKSIQILLPSCWFTSGDNHQSEYFFVTWHILCQHLF